MFFTENRIAKRIQVRTTKIIRTKGRCEISERLSREDFQGACKSVNIFSRNMIVVCESFSLARDRIKPWQRDLKKLRHLLRHIRHFT